MKKYKQVTPEETIDRIKKILTRVGITTKDMHFDQYPFYSCRITIGNSRLSTFNIGTNGKGRSFEYSMASGYAEFMERLQNFVLLPNRQYTTKKYLDTLPPDSEYVKKMIENNLVLDYVYDKNEEVWDIETIISHCKDDLLKLLCADTEEDILKFLKTKLKIEESFMIPFFSVNDNTEKLLPINIISSTTASNGMCAGNTREEALVHGFCEIFERYVAKQIYYNEITPPTIPYSYFENTPVYEELMYLKNNSNFEIIIKDCSLGKGYPVIGVLFIDQSNQNYNFKLGADFVPSIALERCLTEVHQGGKIKLLPNIIIDLKDNLFNDYIENFIDHNFQSFVIDGSGYWPASLFLDKPSYVFEGFDKTYGKSDRDDLDICINLIKNEGYKIYIRDNSIAGFPTYYICIPGFSQLINIKELYGLGLFKKTFFDISVKELHSIDKDKARTIAFAIDENYQLIKYYNRNYQADSYLYNTDQDLLELNIEILAFMLFYFINEMDKAKKYMDLFLTGKERRLYQYHYAISDFIYFRHIKQKSFEETQAILQKMYGTSMAEEVLSDTMDPDKVFSDYQFPNCFHCENCPVSKTCALEYVLRIQKNIQLMAEETQIKQAELSEILKNDLMYRY